MTEVLPAVEDFLIEDIALQQDMPDGPTCRDRPVPCGVFVDDTGIVETSDFVPNDYAWKSLIDTMLSDWMFKTRLRNISDQGPTIQATITGGDGEVRTIQMSRQTDGTYLADIPMIAFAGSIASEIRAQAEGSYGILLIHNADIDADYRGISATAGTYRLYIDTDHDPNLLVADGRQTTTIRFNDTRKKQPGVGVRFSTDNGTIEGDVKQTDANGNASAVYTAANATAMGTVTVAVDERETKLKVFIYSESYNFVDLSKNAQCANYTDQTFVDNTAMTAQSIQQFLQNKGGALAGFTENNKTAAQIIKDAADTSKVNPRVILVTLQKEQRLVTRADLPDGVVKHAMGYGPVATTFTDQVQKGTALLRRRFDEAISFFTIVEKKKYNADGTLNRRWLDQNHLYEVPASGVKNYTAAVSFQPANHSTFLQHVYTNWVTHRTNDEAKAGVQLPVGGVYSFVRLWRSFFPSP